MAEIDRLLKGLIQYKGSDLHLSSGQSVRIRMRGELRQLSAALTPAQMVGSLLREIVNPAQAQVYTDTHELDFTYAPEGLDARFRVNLFMSRTGPGAVFRVIPSKIPSAADLGLPDSILNFCKLDRGLVLVTGATGSGKSTTLAAMVDWINENESSHVLTLEDPIEFVHQSKRSLVNQREVGAHTNSFSNALRAALREDPDVILVGEMRDLETIELALTAAETGHLVFGTLHTASAPKTVDRIINVFPGNRQDQIRTMLSESLKGVVSQQLLKNKAGGRVAAHEILVGTHAISNLIREGKTFQIPSAIQVGRMDGMQSMDQALETLKKAGVIDDETAAAHGSTPPKAKPGANLSSATPTPAPPMLVAVG